ncbi:MAG: regulatory iron-sulfur-containing complex subunit RicT [Candidatus Buchananbacteria bacterium]
MPQIAKIQVVFWDQPYDGKAGDFKVQLGDQVIVKTDWGTDAGKVVSIQEVSDDVLVKLENLVPIVRTITTQDSEMISELNSQREATLDYCKKLVEKNNLPMKIIDAHFSFDGSRLIFPFIADGRVDFRQLVKDLTHHFQKSIRLQQIGIRDEAKISGDFGSCGRTLCCKTHLKELASVTSDLADIQQISHRGSERLSGQCGRLRCCLAFEGEAYKELAKNLPPIGSPIKTPQGKGKVIGWHTLKQTVDVCLEDNDRTIIEFPIKAANN